MQLLSLYLLPELKTIVLEYGPFQRPLINEVELYHQRYALRHEPPDINIQLAHTKVQHRLILDYEFPDLSRILHQPHFSLILNNPCYCGMNRMHILSCDDYGKLLIKRRNKRREALKNQ